MGILWSLRAGVVLLVEREIDGDEVGRRLRC
jgi:hypothetical protein